MKLNNVMLVSIIIAIAIIVISSIKSCNSNTTLPVERIVYVPVPDTTKNVNRIIELEHRLQLTKDSLDCLKDSLGEDLVVARIKLARIKEYTKIVDNKPSQLKFYKGWIKRVLKE